MTRSYSKFLRGYSDLDDPELVSSFEDFASDCRGNGGTVQIRSRDGGFELTCSVLGGGAFERRGD